MRNRFLLLRRPKAEDVEALFRRPSRPTVLAEPIPNAQPNARPCVAEKSIPCIELRVRTGRTGTESAAVGRTGVGEGVSNDADNARRGV
jgi:hypothetical protein